MFGKEQSLVSDPGRTLAFLAPDGSFHDARFQLFDSKGFEALPHTRLDFNDRRYNSRELNGLKLVLLLVANWDVKAANTAVFDVGGQRYAAVTDWGASLGDPGASDPKKRKWNCEAWNKATQTLIEGQDNGFVVFNYQQYAARNIDELSNGIRVDDLKWWLSRMNRLTDGQVKSALRASGASEEEISCFANAFHRRMAAFAAVADGTESKEITRTITSKTTSSRPTHGFGRQR